MEITEFAAGINTVDAIVTGRRILAIWQIMHVSTVLGSTQENTNLRIVDRLSTSKGANNGGLYVSDDIKSLK